MSDWTVILLMATLCVALLSLPRRWRAGGGIAAGACLLLAEPLRDTHGERLAGPCTGMAVVLVIAAGLDAFARYRQGRDAGE